MSGPKTYEGGCHCGKIRYRVSLDLEAPVVVCNCSMCGRSGTMLAFGPASQFTLLSGEEALTSYKFNRQVIDHLFCSTCGIKSFARGEGRQGAAMVAVNVRCLDGVDLESLKINKYDGRDK
jgi:hypothetical protein